MNVLFGVFFFAIFLINTLFAKDSEIKIYIDLINHALGTPFNESLSKFLSEEENWNKFKSLVSVDWEGADAFFKEGYERQVESVLYKHKNFPFGEGAHDYAKFIYWSQLAMNRALPQDPNNRGHLSRKNSPKNFVIYLSILCSQLGLAKELEDANDKSITEFFVNIKDPKVFITSLHDLLKKHLLNESKWGHDKDFLFKLKSAVGNQYLGPAEKPKGDVQEKTLEFSGGKGHENLTERENLRTKGSSESNETAQDGLNPLAKFAIFGSMALIAVILICVIILIVARRKNPSLG